MPLPICYLNGDYLPLREARVSPLDRAFLFADSVYEVIPVYGGRPFRLREHADRLARSLDAIRMTAPLSHAEWADLCRELIARNGAGDQYLYIQVTRGAEFGRHHAIPRGIPPTVFAFATVLEPLSAQILEQGVGAVTATDLRWARRDIKSTALLANVLLKQLSADAGAYETILIGDGALTEGCSTTVHIVERGTVFTPPNGQRILPGTTRDVVTLLADRLGIPWVDGPISDSRLRTADEIWLAFSTRGVLPVTSLDGAAVGDGVPGPLFGRVHRAFHAYIDELAGTPPL
jgi:D-alanine transaminase